MKAKTGLLQVGELRLADLQEDPRNPRTHPEENIKGIMGSLRRFGQVLPIVRDRATGYVIGGHGTLTAMRRLGWETCKVVTIEMASEMERAALRDALNQTGQTSGWDFKVLAEELKAQLDAGIDLGDLGWMDKVLEPLMAAAWDKPEETNEQFRVDGGAALVMRFDAKEAPTVRRAVKAGRPLAGEGASDEDALVAFLRKAMK